MTNCVDFYRIAFSVYELLSTLTGTIDKSLEDIEHKLSGHEVIEMANSSDMVKQFSEITVRDELEGETTELTKVINCDILQSLCISLANCSFRECLCFLHLAGLRERLSIR